MTCDLTSGRLRSECLVGRAGIKKLYFTKFNDYAALTGVTESGGEVTSLGSDPITIYQFDMESNVGNFEEVPTASRENGTAFMTQTVTLTLFYIKPADLATLNNLKRGRWAVWALDFQDKIRFFGQTRGMIATGGSDVSGAAPGDKKGFDLILQAASNNFAPFMADFTNEPFDNFTNVSVTTSGYGPELFTDANAICDSGGNEANAVTPWTSTGLTGTGANVFESQASVVHTGSYAFHGNSNDTPTSGCNFQYYNGTKLTIGETYLLSAYHRHVGTGGNWECRANWGDGLTVLATVTNADTTFTYFSQEFIATAQALTLQWREIGANDGGVYADNLSLKQKL